MNRSLGLLVASLVLTGLLVATSPAVILLSDRGQWPKDWPVELEPLRETSRTRQIGTGIHENVYEIPIPDRETFDRVWPAILKVRTPGSPLTLRRTTPPGAAEANRFEKNELPTIRIYGPSGGIQTQGGIDHKNPPNFEKLIQEGRALRAQGPWPDLIVGKNGELPEYVVSDLVDGRMTWLPADPYDKAERALFPALIFNRARIDVELVIDGQIIDLNRVRLPDGAIIIDRRFDAAKSRPPEE